MTTTVTVTVRAIGTDNNSDPIDEYTLDTGTRSAQAFSARDWAQLTRIMPKSKRSVDPTKSAAAKKGAESRSQNGSTPAEAPLEPSNT